MSVHPYSLVLLYCWYSIPVLSIDFCGFPLTGLIIMYNGTYLFTLAGEICDFIIQIFNQNKEKGRQRLHRAAIKFRHHHGSPGPQSWITYFFRNHWMSLAVAEPNFCWLVTLTFAQVLMPTAIEVTTYTDQRRDSVAICSQQTWGTTQAYWAMVRRHHSWRVR